MRLQDKAFRFEAVVLPLAVVDLAKDPSVAAHFTTSLTRNSKCDEALARNGIDAFAEVDANAVRCVEWQRQRHATGSHPTHRVFGVGWLPHPTAPSALPDSGSATPLGIVRVAPRPA